jgi:hypothetical protein
MDDDFLYKFRKEPRPAFSKGLYERINRPMKTKPITQRVFAANWKTALAGLAIVIVLALVVSPGARAMAQDFLNLFRVQRFAAISIDPARISQLENNKVDIESLLSASTQVVKDPGKPEVVSSPEAAGQQAGFTVRVPSTLPAGFSLQDIRVQGEGTVRFKADTAKLQTLIDTLGVTDVQIPAQLNGQTVTVDKPAMVAMNYQNGNNHLIFMQSRNPQIALPDGVDLPQLGEIALRVAGMAPDEAHRFAQSIDWNSTMLIPVPANASSFRQVDVRGTTGLLITTSSAGLVPPAVQKNANGVPEIKAPRDIQPGSILLWAEGDMVYAVNGTGNVALVDFANSLH